MMSYPRRSSESCNLYKSTLHKNFYYLGAKCWNIIEHIDKFSKTYKAQLLRLIITFPNLTTHMTTFIVLLSLKLVNFPVSEREILDVTSSDPGDLIVYLFYCVVEYYNYLISDVFNLFSCSDIIIKLIS